MREPTVPEAKAAVSERTRFLAIALVLTVAIPAVASAGPEIGARTLYVVEFGCGTAGEDEAGVVPGEYATSTTVTNAALAEKSLAAYINLTVPSTSRSDTIVLPFGAGDSSTLDCDTLLNAFVLPVPLDPSTYFQGALVLESRRDFFDVVSRSTASGDSGSPSLDVRTVPAKTAMRVRAREHKVEICHIPPGNPARLHTIRVDESSVGDHIAHGDHRGACNDAD